MKINNGNNLLKIFQGIILRTKNLSSAVTVTETKYFENTLTYSKSV